MSQKMIHFRGQFLPQVEVYTALIINLPAPELCEGCEYFGTCYDDSQSADNCALRAVARDLRP